MKTKQVAPWNLKVGQKLKQNYRFNTITSIEKTRGIFTGKAMWVVKTDALMFEAQSIFHAKGTRLPLQKATILK